MRELSAYVVFGKPQSIAALMLLAFALQCGWMIARHPLALSEQDHIWSGREQLEYGSSPKLYNYTPLTNVAAAVPLRLDAGRLETRDPTPQHVEREVRRLRWILRLPFLMAGLLLGASLWYVARRLYGNGGGYTALALYCSSPMMVLKSATINDKLFATWGAFGIIFTAIAISHNLYAPWKKWRYRAILLALAIALGWASHPAVVVLLPLGLLFMLYLAPGRRSVAFLLMMLAVLVALVLVHAAYGFSPRAMLNGIDVRDWLRYEPADARGIFFSRLDFLLRFPPALALMASAAVVTYFAWKRTRYFGNTSPLLALALLLYLAMVMPASSYFSAWALPFLFVFIGGIWADLLETRHRWLALAAVLVVVAEDAFATSKLF